MNRKSIRLRDRSGSSIVPDAVQRILALVGGQRSVIVFANSLRLAESPPPG
ncbi:hypothetical protein ACH47Z_38760 [Streptomyces sp. NPDC020192]|uniref:hypothetical protein n=1 Tax=Streptomyces sp. NPDC020192 TaxID=3365066 RepID=UPI0037AEC526